MILLIFWCSFVCLWFLWNMRRVIIEKNGNYFSSYKGSVGRLVAWQPALRTCLVTNLTTCMLLVTFPNAIYLPSSFLYMYTGWFNLFIGRHVSSKFLCSDARINYKSIWFGRFWKILLRTVQSIQLLYICLELTSIGRGCNQYLRVIISF